jgi:hypothetical protein
LTPEHPPKVPCHKIGLSTPIQGYRGQVSGGLAAPIPTPTSRLLSPNPLGLSLSPMGPSLGVLQQPIPAPVIGTTSHPVDLDQSNMDLEQSAADMKQLAVGP